MGRAAVVLIYATLALLLLLVLRTNHSPGHPGHQHHRRLKLRNFSFTSPPASAERHIPFDPLIADIEQRREDREWERSHFNIPSAPGEEAQPEWEDFIDAEDYINNEDRFNITSRIVLLFPRVDVAPADGFVSLEELTEWNLRQAVKEVMHRTEREMELHDKNRDGHVSFAEYEPPSWSRNDNSTAFGYDFGWWKEDHFNASDIDGDGLLNKTEFNDFLHPSDSSNPRLIKWLCHEEIRERDKDKDGMLSFQEFFNGLFDSLSSFDGVYNRSDTSDGAPAKQLFNDLDKDNNGFLTAEELMSVIGNLHPSERYYAKQQAEYVLSQADADKDGRLSLNEMIEHPYVFYSAIFSDDDDNGFDFHDEFR
ncbi:Calmodulin-like protein 8 [Apostasia shenzhenica]|uniref:Calmodulin-like protein 8 n=1 Tax=Apostasia shenzhenica TaxID=1088818 RepID=A0A2I0ANY0_9ASPA|nr:Calmodulin-like protein 8 [Apostasia shenzhenica]